MASSPGYETGASRARTSKNPGWRRIRRGSLKERGRGNEEDIVHPHLVVVAPERPAVDKLLAEEVLVADIEAAEDLDLRPLLTPPAALAGCSPLHAPHQASNLTLTKLIMLPVRRRKPKAREPVAAIVVQVMGDFSPEVFQNLMLSDPSSSKMR